MIRNILGVIVILAFALITEGFDTGIPSGVIITLAVGIIFIITGAKLGGIGKADNPLGRFFIRLGSWVAIIIVVIGANEMSRPQYWDVVVRESLEDVSPTMAIVLPPSQYTAGYENAEWKMEVESLRRTLERQDLSTMEKVEATKALTARLQPKDTIAIGVIDRMVDAAFGSKVTVQPMQSIANGAKWGFLILAAFGLALFTFTDKLLAKGFGFAVLLVGLYFGGIYLFPRAADLLTRWWEGSWEAQASIICLGLLILFGIGYWFFQATEEEEE